jgi:hypothetical protein
MRLPRPSHDPSALIGFFQEALETLGAVCERTWHDRLQVVAEGAAARLWNPNGELMETEIQFPPADQSGPRDASRQVFPGCPLTFHLAEALGPPTLQLQRATLQFSDQAKPPAPDVAEKLWHLQYPGALRWRLDSPFQADWHFSLLVLARCEIQAIDQHWSLHRLAISLPDGHPDDALAREVDFCRVVADASTAVPWPTPDPSAWRQHLSRALAQELETDLAAIRHRQEHYLRRELDRIDEYFENYEKELKTRLHRQRRDESKLKLEERLAAAKSEHERRRTDQIQRHEIRVIPHLDALLLLTEPAWQATVTVLRRTGPQTTTALFVTRARRWVV